MPMTVSFSAILTSAILLLAPFATGSQQPVLVLDGVIVAANPVHSVALIREGGAQRARALRVGQIYRGYTLVEISSGWVRLRGEVGTVVLELGGGGPSASIDRPGPSPKPAEPELAWQRRTYSRATDGRRLDKEIPVILSDTELTPRVQRGEIHGLELLRIPDGTLLSEAGLRPGDVLKSLNGEPLHGLESLWKLLARFDGQSELRLIVERRGEVVRLAYAIEN